MADFDKWRKALGDAAYLRTQQDIARRALDTASVERDRLFLDGNTAAYRNAQAQVETRMREVESFAPRISTADAEARREEPTQAVKRERYCANAARARAMNMNPATQAALDKLCRDHGGDPLAALPIMTASVNDAGVPIAAAAPAPNVLLPIVAIAGLAAVAGAYLWSQRKAAPAPRRR